MTFYELSIVATLSATLAVVCVYLFLYLLYRHAYMGLWAFFWIIHFASQVFYRTPLNQMSAMELALAQLLSISNYVLLIYATSKFFERKIYKCWYYSALAVIVAGNCCFYFDVPFLIKTLPTFTFIAYVNLWHGWMFIRHLDSKGWGKTVVGLSFIGLGLHAFDMPFLITIKWFAPWGFLISGSLRFIISLGTLMLYVEKTARELIAKEQQYRLLAENAADIIYLYRLKPTHGIEYVSPSIVKLTGHECDAFYKSPDLLFSLVHPGDSFIVESLADDPVSVASSPLVMRLIRRDHSLVWVEQTTVPIIDETGTCTCFEGIIRDISARKEIEQDVARLDRLNTVGQMAASVAHEIRNPLTTVRGYLQYFLTRPNFAVFRDQFDMLISELDRTNLIIKEYLSLSQNKARDLKTCQLNSIILDLFPLIKADSNASSKDVCHNLEATPAIHLDEKEIRQLILNLVRNGLEAMAPGGTITIRTYVSESGDVVLSIQDQGTGIPQHVLDNIGKPFVTTKENGTGLGLAVVYRIANDHQASIRVDSGPRGTTFHIVFKAE